MTSPDMVYNLQPGQYQVGDIIFGKNTTVPVTTFDPKAYDVNTQDFQTSWADEVRFGRDQFKPATVEVSFMVLNNYMLPGHESEKPNFWQGMPKVDDFRRLWRFDQGRRVSGAMMPFYFGSKDRDRSLANGKPGNYITKVFFGRPGQITIEKDDRLAGGTQCMAQFRLADTLTYRWSETALPVTQQADPQFIYRDPQWDGQADSWLRIIAAGPMTNPKFTIGDQTIQIQTTLAAGDVMELSSYPWLRRIVNSNRENLTANIVGQSQYLDQLKIPAGVPVPVRWTSDEVNTFVPALGNQQWQEDINTMDDGWFHSLPIQGFSTIKGKVVVRPYMNIFSNKWFQKTLTAGAFAGTSACIHTAQQFSTDSQKVQANIAPPFLGRSAMVFKSDVGMTNFAALEVQAGGLIGDVWHAGNYIRLHYGTSPTQLTNVFQWKNPSLFGWSDTDRIAAKYDPATKTYTIYFNDTVIGTWVDSTQKVTGGPTKRYQGFIFNLSNDLLDVGVGWRNILAYDTATVPAPLGSVYLMWRDAWMGIQ